MFGTTEMKPFTHQVEINEAERELYIFRIESDGTRSLFTTVKLPATKGWSEEAKDLAMALGQNLLLDSPIARRLLDL
jgi:hypothetical protein